MAKKIKKFDFSNSEKHKSKKYNWKDWLNGDIWQLTRGEDFKIEVTNFRAQAFTNAKRRKLMLRTSVSGDVITLQAYKEA